MGDPLSVAVSILTILEVTSAVGRFLKEIAKLRRAPTILLDLNNKLVDLQMLVRRVHDLSEQQSDVLPRPSDEGLLLSLNNVQSLLSRFENLIAYDLTVVRSCSGQLELDKSRWLCAKSKVKRLKEDLEAEKKDLSLQLALLSRYKEAIATKRSH